MSLSDALLGTLLGTVAPIDFLFLFPLCVAIAIVSSAAHRESVPEILRHAVRSSVMLIVGLLAFMVGISYFAQWILP
ncbi:MAG: hypothetical protein AAGD14_12055 [Planctomycetota bacterium]